MRHFAPFGLVALALLAAQGVGAQATAFVGGTLWDGTGAAAVPNATLVVRNGRVISAGPGAAPAGARVVDLSGRWIVPGLVNAHGHVTGQWAGADVTDPAERLRQDLLLYARYGVTTVNSLGGEPEAARALRDAQGAPAPGRARLHYAGSVIYETTPDAARAAVRTNSSLDPDWIKVRVDDDLGSSEKMPWPAVEALIEEAHARDLRVATHLFYLEDAKRLLRAGTDLVAHSVRDADVDAELVRLLADHGVCYVPTLTREVSTFVYAERPDFFDDPFFQRWASASEVAHVSQPAFMQAMAVSPAARAYREALVVAQRNVAALDRAGATIAMGTDSGPAGRFPGYFEHLELALMAEAGMSAPAVLESATRQAAACLGLPDVGTLEPGRWADFLVLTANPLDDVANTRSLETVYVGGAPIR